MDSLRQHEIQIRYTRILREGDTPRFTHFDFQLEDSVYFYPASTVKFPIAVLALEKLNRLNELNLETRYFLEGDTITHQFSRDIELIFAISDNAASNRLLEFLGQDAINEGLRARNISPVRISHRLGVKNADEVTTRPIIAYLNDSTTTLLPEIANREPQPLHLAGIEKGSGFYLGDSLVHEAFDFGLKNYYPIRAQHEVLMRVMFPENYPEGQRFQLSEAQRSYLLQCMQAIPRAVGLEESEYYDSYVKFFVYGDRKSRIPDHVKIFNKVGYAYGTLTDSAYFIDSETGLEFMLTATILVNRDGIFNDDAYEYEKVGIPFLAELGREIYQLELKSKR